MKDLPNKYNHKETEARWQKKWVETGVFNWDESKDRSENFVIDTPPPTVSGLLHMGHVFSYTQADFIARYKRMQGKNVFYPMGFDDNGLPTERLVEKVKKIRASDLSREEFIKICEEVVVEAENEFRILFKSIALSVDWNQEYQTISPESRKISQLSFLDLFSKNYVYKKLQPMLWDPVDRTALAQAEIEDKEFDSTMNEIQFLTDSGKSITIATTRPELIISCVAVLYHPDDVRYQNLKDQNAITSLFGVKVPIIPDENVKMDKGTGLVMCCTFGDETDISWWKKYNLLTRISLDQYGKISLNIDEKTINFQNQDLHSVINQNNSISIEKAIEYSQKINGLKAKVARETIIDLLKKDNLLLKQTNIKHFVKCAERSGAPLEIRPTSQWFVKILDKKEDLLKKSSECDWHPNYMKQRVEQWIEGLSWDWCISRQRYFGVPFPVWYSKRPGEVGKILVAKADQLPVNPLVDLPCGYTAEEVEPECDVMDTWATSSVSPQLSSKSISEKFAIDYDRHKKLFPADLRPQAHEIIRTWAFYTIVKSYLHEEEIPWKNLMISGWCLAEDKTKMSKSKGNVITPTSLIEDKGSDVVRFWASTAKLGADTAYSEDVLKIGKKLVTKLWNATKFAAIHLNKLNEDPNSAIEDFEQRKIFETIDIWVISRLYKTIQKSTEEFEKFEYSNARSAIEDFFWNDFCDNYLELVKVRVYGENSNSSIQSQMSAVHTIYHCLDAILKLFTPIVPHITEELYSHIFEKKHKEYGGSINSLNTWPQIKDYFFNEDAEIHGKKCVSILNAVRKLKAERNVSIKWPLHFLYAQVEDNAISIDKIANDLKNVSNASEIILQERMPKDGFGGETITEDGKKVIVEFAIEAN